MRQGLAAVGCRGQLGLMAPAVRVEVHLGAGLPCFGIVGLPAAAVRESKDRIRAALASLGFEFPAGRITVSLAPADLPKEGGRYDLPIALSILLASGQVTPAGAGAEAVATGEFYGELSLNGDLLPVRGLVPAAAQAAREQRPMFVPSGNLAETRVVRHPRLHGARSLREVCAWLEQRDATAAAVPVTDLLCAPPAAALDLAEVRGQLLPPLTVDEALEVAAIASVSAAGFDPRAFGARPFRAPHHSASAPALVGGGAMARPGEVSLAHRGILFLDELPEFGRSVLETLRESLENGSVVISRACGLAQKAGFLLHKVGSLTS